MSIERILVIVILAIIAIALAVWFFGDFADDDRRDRDSAPIVSTL